MKTVIDGLHRVFEHRIRLGIMSVLAVNDTLDFNSLKAYLDVTDGNLASNLKTLENENFIGVKKAFVGKKPNTKYFMTETGKKAFDLHLQTLEAIIQRRNKGLTGKDTSPN